MVKTGLNSGSRNLAPGVRRKLTCAPDDSPEAEQLGRRLPMEVIGGGPKCGALHLRLALALLSLVAVLLLFTWEESRTVPTPISAVHAQEAELLSADDCARCHGDDERSLAMACYDCHEVLAEQLEFGLGFHGHLTEVDAKACGSCHIEHAGREFPLVAEHSFRKAGFATREDFDHPFADYDLDGAHLELACAECHAKADAELLLPGERRFQGLSRECVSCHEESPHEGRMQRACVECHGQERPFAELSTFEHDERFPLVGAHAIDDCQACHKPGTSESIEDRASLESLPAVRGCGDCHDFEHQESFLAQAARLIEEADDDRCTQCHLDSHLSFLDARDELTSPWHAASGYPLDSPHDEVTCAECHDPALEWRGRFPGRARSDCAACHEDPHGAQFVTSANFIDCHDCHKLSGFLPVAFDRDEHERTDFPLASAHQAVGCFECHEAHPEPGTDRRWKGVDQRCASCHDDAHDGHFDAHLASLASEETSECSDCHEPTRFAEASEDFEVDHERWTGFALAGSHGEIECEACHLPAPTRDELGRVFGRILDSWGAVPTATQPCADCHEDPHAVDFDAPGKPESVEGRFGCARCHDELAFDRAPFGEFDHETWTERHLGGAHLELDCQQCHVPTPSADELGRRFGRVREVFGQAIEECATCHEDPHWGIFDGEHAPDRVEGRQGCARCHDESRFVRLLLEDFDHDLWTNTDFAGKHAAQGCDDCHPKLLDPGYAARGRQEARGRSCVTCHVDPHAGQFAEDGRNDCRICHEDQQDWSELLFDHQVDSRYALDEVHEPLDCEACHQPYPQLGGAPIVRYKPLGVECIDCHPIDDGDGQ